MLVAALHTGFGQTENFNDGNDDGWIHFAPLEAFGFPSTFSFPEDGLGGKAYRIQSSAPTIALFGPARAGSRVSTAYSDFTAAVDLVDWDNSLDQSIGFLFRTENLGIGSTIGYSMNYNTQQISGGPGQIQFNIVTAEVPSGAIRFADLSLDPERDYRFVLNAQGKQLTGRVYDLLDLTSPLVTFSVENSVYAQGEAGIFNFYAGMATVDPAAGRTDSTFDNYTAAADPVSVPEPATPRGIPNWPQPIELTPLNRTTFHPAELGIQFTATTLSDETVLPENVSVFLNGRDMSNSVNFADTDSGFAVHVGSLSPNTVYDAAILLENATGIRSTTEWTFDTFSEDFLETDDVKVIEAEDYNFGSGQFINEPLPSGRSTDSTKVNAGSGYLDRIGEPGVDYFDHSEEDGSGETPAYRFLDFVGTQAGSSEIGAIDTFGGLDSPINDVIRQRLAILNLPEYQVRGTEGGEWLNYTQEFTEHAYNVFLRVAARASQQVFLDEVTSDPSIPNQTTSRLGVFEVPNLGMITNYRFVPLTDENGERLTLKLSGTTTLRLTLDGEPQLRTQGTMALNYMMFVPVESETTGDIIVESAQTVNGPFAVETTAVFSSDSVSIPISENARFFRFGLSPERANSFTILAVESANQNLVVRFAR